MLCERRFMRKGGARDLRGVDRAEWSMLTSLISQERTVRIVLALCCKDSENEGAGTGRANCRFKNNKRKPFFLEERIRGCFRTGSSADVSLHVCDPLEPITRMGLVTWLSKPTQKIGAIPIRPATQARCTSIISDHTSHHHPLPANHSSPRHNK